MSPDEAFQSYMSAIRSGDRREAFEVVERARAAGLALSVLYLEVFQPALREVGRLWQENLMSVAEEHLATAITEAAMLRVYADLDLPDRGEPLLIAACGETERHEVGLRMLCDFLDVDGWETVFLGCNVPNDSLVAMIRERRPDAVALSASIAPHLPQLKRTIAAIRDAAGDEQPLIVVGGRPFLEQPDLAEALGADLTAPDAAEAARLLRERLP